MKKTYISFAILFLIGKMVTAQLTITPSTVNVSCNGGSDGLASLIVTGGTPSYTYLWSPGGQTTATINSLSAGTYTATVTDALSAATTATITVTEPQPLNIVLTSLNPTDSTSCNGSASALVSGGTSPYSYIWLAGGETTSTINGKCEGEYSFHVADSHGCLKNDSINLIGVATNIKSQDSFSTPFLIFPNPSTENLTIRFPDQQNFTLQIIDLNSRVVYSNINANHTENIDCSGFSSGVYFVKAVNERTVLTGKLIKE